MNYRASLLVLSLLGAILWPRPGITSTEIDSKNLDIGETIVIQSRVLEEH